MGSTISKQANAEQQRIRMLTHPIPKVVTALAVPSMMQQLINVLYNLVDTYFVSQISTSAAAAVGIVFSLVSLINALMFGVSMGAKGLISRRLGAGEVGEASKFASTCLAMELVIGIFATSMGLIFLKPILYFFGASDTMMPHAIPYARWILIGVLLHCVDAACSCTLAAQGKTFYTMLGFGVASLCNIVLDWLFVFPLQMGAGGAALATAISQGISMLILLWAIYSGKSAIKFHPKYVSRKLRTYFDIVHNGIATVFRQGTASLATTLLNRLANPYGDAVVAAISIANKIYLMCRNLVLGFGQGFQPVAGYNYGAGVRSRVKKAFWFACAMGTIICLIGTAFLALMPETLIGLFRKDADVVSVGAQMLRYYALVLPLLAYSTFVNQMYQCLGFSLWATILACCRQCIFFVPALYILHGLLGQTGLIMTQPAADLLTFLASIPFQIWFFRKILSKPDAKIKFQQ